MKKYSVIQIYSKIPAVITAVITDQDTFSSIIATFDNTFLLNDMFNIELDGKIQGWVTKLSLENNFMSLYVFVEPKENLSVMSHLYYRLSEFFYKGFNFEARNINLNQVEHKKIFESTPEERMEFYYYPGFVPSEFYHL